MLNQTLKDGLSRSASTIVAAKDAEPPLLSQSQQQPRWRQPRTFDFIPARYVLYFLSWSGFLVSFMMRNDINMALVVMIKNGTKVGDANGTANTTTTTEATPASPNDGEFDWSEGVEATILSSFYWCYVLSQVVGGVATQHFGTKNIFGWSQFATALCSLCIPWAADLHYAAVIALRCVQGFASGLTWPAMYAIVGHWIPPSERSRFMSSFQGFSIGIGLTYPLCGFIIAHAGWRQVFYTTGTIGVAWCAMWYVLAYNTPQLHPRISGDELKYIETNIGQEIKEGIGMKVPWLRIFTSLPVWSIGVTTFGRIWVHYTFILSGPKYMKYILGFDIEKNGVLSGLPFLCSYVSSVFFCWAADALVTSQRMRLTSVRKLFTAMSQIVPGLLCLLIGYWGQSEQYIVPVIVVWFVAVTMITASYAGAMATIVDVAPNLAGPVLAFAQTIHMTASFVSPVVSALIVSDKTSLGQWRFVFAVAAIVATCTYVMFQVFGTSDIQPWNYPASSGGHRSSASPNKSGGGGGGGGGRDNTSPDSCMSTTTGGGSVTNDDDDAELGNGELDDDDERGRMWPGNGNNNMATIITTTTTTTRRKGDAESA